MSIEKLLKPYIEAWVSSLFDPRAISFKAADERGVKLVRAACQKVPAVYYKFREHLNRNAFLCGCLDFTDQETTEHLIVGFGYKYGSTTKISAITHIIGERNSVSVPESLQQNIKKHLESEYRNEVLLFHNHPRNVLNVMIDNLPLASNTDRDTWLRYFVQPLNALKAFMGGGRVRCYLGENGFVREFKTPNLLVVLNQLSQVSR